MPLSDRQKQFTEALMAGNPHLDIAGIPLVSACAATGNATAENLVRPVTTGPKDHGSDGTMQWRLGRLDGPGSLKGWAAANGLAWDTLETQAWFFLYEAKRDYAGLYADLLAGTKSIETLTADIEKYYERPATLSDLDTRIKYAKNTMAIMQGVELPHPEVPEAPVPAPAPLSGTVSISVVENDFQAAKTAYKTAIAALDVAKRELTTKAAALVQVAAYMADQLNEAKDLLK